ncbi:MAG: hypothetical protein LBD11_02265 [Candidatus Peribacteria bacterium]|jgi:hypothetical protein|nr:hypothetical protein [Candidatus Peribacteria bacterium]
METPVHSHFHKVYSTVLVSAALFVVGELETVQATNLVLGETLEAAVTPNMLSQSPASITFSEASATADPTAVEYKEILEAQIPALTASVMISFCEEEMKVKFKEQEKIEITKHLTQFFKNSPVCRIEDGKVKLLMTAAYADDAAKELMPYFVNKIDGRLKVGYEVGAFLGGHDNMNAYVWGKIKKHLKTLKATDAKNTFIKDI